MKVHSLILFFHFHFSFFDNCFQTTLSQHSGLFFLMIGARLVNDDDPECRKLCAKCIKEMIIRLPHNHRNRLFDIIILWLKDSKVK